MGHKKNIHIIRYEEKLSEQEAKERDGRLLIQMRASLRGAIGKDLNKDPRQDPEEECFQQRKQQVLYKGLREEQTCHVGGTARRPLARAEMRLKQ